MSGNWYTLKTEFSQNEFYMCILGAEQNDYKCTINTDLDKLGISDVDDFILPLYEEFENLKYKGSAYAQIGFLYMNHIVVDSLKIIKKINNEYIRAEITKDAIYFDGNTETLNQMFRYFGFNQDIDVNIYNNENVVI